MNHLEWKTTNGAGPTTHYGYWEGAKCFSIYQPLSGHTIGQSRNVTSIKGYNIKSCLPGFRDDLPTQPTVEAAKVFAERMLQRWAAKRGLLFKAHIVVTDAMCIAAARVVAANAGEDYDRIGEFAQGVLRETQRKAITEALQAREPHAADAARKQA